MDLRKSDLQEFAGKEVQYILTSTNYGHTVNNRDSEDWHTALDMMTKYLQRVIAKGKMKPIKSVHEISGFLKECTLFKVAEILKTVSSWTEFKEFVAVNMPAYRLNSRVLINRSDGKGVGGFVWKCKFEVPNRISRKFSPKVCEGSTDLLQLLKDANDRITELQNRLHTIELMVQEDHVEIEEGLPDKIMNHVHLGDRVRFLKKED